MYFGERELFDLIQISLKYVNKGLNDNESSLVQAKARRWSGD